MGKGKRSGNRKPSSATPTSSPNHSGGGGQGSQQQSSSLMLLRELLKEDDGSAQAATTTSILLEKLGIGGLDRQVKTLLRRALASRLLPPEVARRLGVKHVRGLLLYGPPGTGKTLIARQLAQLLNAHEPKLISGPELLSMWVGRSEENIRKVFAEAEEEFKEKGSQARLHVIIFDEVDALMRKRGSRHDSSGVLDSCVNQLLAKIDGLAANDNILVIGTTNRKDLLDDAVLRPGRLEVHVEVGLPDERGRARIFQVHTAGFRREGCLAPDVDVGELARRTANFTGAEIEGVVKGGLSFALQRQLSSASTSPLSLSMADMRRALREARPHFGSGSQAGVAWMQPGPGLVVSDFRPEVPLLLQEVMACLRQQASVAGSGALPPLLTLLLQGPPGAGKSAVLARIGAMATDFTFRRRLTAQDLLGLGEDAAADALVQAVHDAHQCPLSLLLLDDLEALAHYSAANGGRAAPTRLHTLLALLDRAPPSAGSREEDGHVVGSSKAVAKARTCVIVATTSLDDATLAHLGLLPKFARRFVLPVVETPKQAAALLAGATGKPPSCPGDIETALKREGPLTPRAVLRMEAFAASAAASEAQ